MSRREFYAWVEQASREAGAYQQDDPHHWSGTDDDEWWTKARENRDRALGR